MAERVGFEPTIPVKVCPLSRRIVSTTHAPLRRKQLSAVSHQLKQTSFANDTTKRLTTVFKERLQQLGGAAGKDAAANFYFVIQLRMIQQLHYRLHSARFGIVRAVHEAVDPGVHQGSGAHRARFNCSKQVALRETMVTEDCSRLA